MLINDFNPQEESIEQEQNHFSLSHSKPANLSIIHSLKTTKIPFSKRQLAQNIHLYNMSKLIRNSFFAQSKACKSFHPTFSENSKNPLL